MTHYPGNLELCALFNEEVAQLGGTVTDQVETSNNLFLRALLPKGRHVQPRDFIGHGLAVRTRDSKIVVHPYTFRQVCGNGAIHVENIASRVVERAEQPWASEHVTWRVREAIRASSDAGAFGDNLSEMETMLSQEVRMPLAVASVYSRLGDSKLVGMIMDRFLDERDRSVFGLMNAITAQARDEPSPEQRWRLEALGGGILAVLRPPAPVLAPGRNRTLPRMKRQDARLTV